MFFDDDLGFKKIKKELEKLTRLKVIIDIDPEKYYKDTNIKAEDVEVWMEFGNEKFNVKYPSRPFWRTAFDVNVNKVQKLYEKRIDMIIAGTGTAEGLGHEIGKYMVNKIKATIRNGQFAELAESTKKRKKSDKPLIDTKILYKSIRYRIEWS